MNNDYSSINGVIQYLVANSNKLVAIICLMAGAYLSIEVIKYYVSGEIYPVEARVHKLNSKVSGLERDVASKLGSIDLISARMIKVGLADCKSEDDVMHRIDLWKGIVDGKPHGAQIAALSLLCEYDRNFFTTYGSPTLAGRVCRGIP